MEGNGANGMGEAGDAGAALGEADGKAQGSGKGEALPGRQSTGGKKKESDALAFSPERIAYVREHWPDGTLPRTMLAAINALPGPAVSIDAVRVKAKRLGLRRPDGFSSKVAKFNHAREAKTFTKARDELLRKQWQDGIQNYVILASLNALPGRMINSDQLRVRAKRIGAKRPEGFIPERRPSKKEDGSVANVANPKERGEVRFVRDGNVILGTYEDIREWAGRHGLDWLGYQVTELHKLCDRLGMPKIYQVEELPE